jgi:hypothetical protein
MCMYVQNIYRSIIIIYFDPKTKIVIHRIL